MMIEYNTDIIEALNEILPTHYEMALSRNATVPCLSVMELSNISHAQGDTIGYCRISYQIKVWARDIEIVNHYAALVDDVMRKRGWVRTSTNELHDNQSTMIQKILGYEAYGLETY